MKKELPAGRIEGPFMQLPFHTFYVLLEAWSQKAPGESRILQYLSFPEGNSVNDNIDASYTSVSHASREDAIRLVRVIYGQDGHQKSFPHHPSLSKSLFRFQWNGQFYFNTCLSVGFSSSFKILKTFSTAIQWMVQQKQKL